MLNCKEITRRVASDEYREAGSLSRLRIEFHMLFCQGCRRFTQQLKQIKQQAQRQSPPAPDPQDLERLEAQLLAKLDRRDHG